MDIAIIVTDWKEVLYTNHVFERVFGIHESTILDDAFALRFDKPGHWNDIKKGGSARLAFINVFGKKIDLLCSCKKDKDAYIFTFITSQKLKDKKQEKLFDKDIYLEFLNVLTSIKDIAWIKDRNLKIVSVNMAYAKKAGLKSPEEAENKTDFDIWDRECSRTYREHDLLVLEKKEAMTFTEPNRSDDEKSWFEVIKTPIFTPNGDVAGIFGVAIDVSDQTQGVGKAGQSRDELEKMVSRRTADLEKAYNKLKAELLERKILERALNESRQDHITLINAIPDLIFIISGDGYFTGFKSGDTDTLYTEPSDFIGKHIRDVLPPDIAKDTEEYVKKTLSTGNTHNYSYSILIQNRIRHYNASFSVKDDNSVLVVSRDMTDSVDMANLIIKSEERFKTIFNSSPDPMVIGNIKDNTFMDANTAMLEKLGLSRDEFIGTTFDELRSKAKAFITKESTDMILDSDADSSNLEVDTISEDGRTSHYLYSSRKITIDGQESILAIFRDVTEIRRIQVELENSEFRNKQLSDGVNTPLFVHNGERFKYFNPAFAQNLGYSKEELENIYIYEVLAPSQRKMMQENFKRRMRGENAPAQSAVTMITKSGEKRIWEILISRVVYDNQDCSLISALDTTELHEIRNKLEEANIFLDSLISSIHEVIFAKDLEGRYIFYRWPELERMGLIDPSSFLGKRVEDTISQAEHVDRTNKYFEQVIETDRSVSYETNIYIHGTGKHEDFRLTLSPLKNSNDETIGVVGFGKSITKELIMEKRALESESRYIGIVKALGDIVFQVDDDKISFISPSAEQTLGLKIGEIVGSNINGIIPTWDMQIKNATLFPQTVEFCTYDLAGYEHSFEAKVNKLGDSFFGVAREITQRNIVSSAREKMRSRLAHELKNPITLILGYAEILKGTLENKEAANMAEIIYDAALREVRKINHVFNSELTDREFFFDVIESYKFFKRVEDELKMLALEMAKNYHNKTDIEFSFKIDPSIAGIKMRIDDDSIVEVFENLVSNSIKYSPPDRLSIDIDVSIKDYRFVVLFTDKGFGIPEPDRGKVFAPFFRSSRDHDRIEGKGIGLTNVKLNIDANGGNISIEESSDSGTTFKITLPTYGTLH